MTSMIAGRMAEAASMLIDALDQQQRSVACRRFPDDEERRLWFYTPTDHGGLPLAAMTSAQHQHVHRLVATGLSKAGYIAMATIMGLENILDRIEDWRGSASRERYRDPLLYYITIFGDPGDEGAWAWRFGGHHVSLHYTILDGEVVASTPSFLGANPAASPLLGPHLHRPLAALEDLGRDLFRALDQEKRGKALASAVAPTDLISGNRPVLNLQEQPLPEVRLRRVPLEDRAERPLFPEQEGGQGGERVGRDSLETFSLTTRPKGIGTTDLNEHERGILRALIDVYLDRLPDALADQQAGLVDREFEKLAFLWAGGDERCQPHYYRIQGERLFIEYDNTQNGANHVHTVWRDLANDFAGDVLARHYAEHAHESAGKG